MLLLLLLLFVVYHRVLTAIGLIVIALGTGGIKPCVSAFGGDQFKEGDVSLATSKGRRCGRYLVSETMV